jgi:hypothetical protein
MTTREERLSRFCDLVDVLLGDVERHIADSRNVDDPFTRRGFVRCMCAYIEGVAYVMKQAALLEHEASIPLFSSAEVMLLSEHSADLDNDGSLVQKDSRLRTLPNIRFAFSSFARAQGVELRLDFGGPEWEALRKAFEVRGSLMHPKNLDDLEVSEAEAKAALVAGEWFHAGFLSLVSQTPAKDRVATMERKLPKLHSPAA